MPETKPNILVVEDAPDMLEMATVFLQNSGYDVTQMENGDSALEFLESNYNSVDVVLSDILMPGIDGYELCEKIKNDDRMSSLPVVFMSSLTDLDEKIKGYSVGADEYVTKPVAFEELTEKLKRLINFVDNNKQLKQQITVSNSAAMEAMNYSSDLGQILNFYRISLDTQTYDQLATNIFEITGFLGLKTTVLFATNEGNKFFGDTGVAAPLEVNILEMARNKSRFFDFNSRTIVNYPTFSLLIKNMPLDKPERYGVLKDTLGALGDAIEARTRSLIANSVEEKRIQLIKTVQTATDETAQTMTDVQNETEKAIDYMMEEIEDAFISLGLLEQQEQKIRDIVGECLARSHVAFEKGKHLNSLFENIKTQLNKTLSIKSN